jgi:hypothetical protein
MEPKTVGEIARLVAIVVAALVVSYAIGIHVTRWLILSLTETKGE